MLKNLTYENVNRWRKQIGTPHWARKVIEALENEKKKQLDL